MMRSRVLDDSPSAPPPFLPFRSRNARARYPRLAVPQRLGVGRVAGPTGLEPAHVLTNARGTRLNDEVAGPRRFPVSPATLPPLPIEKRSRQIPAPRSPAASRCRKGGGADGARTRSRSDERSRNAAE